jgi:hypothetical protein
MTRSGSLAHDVSGVINTCYLQALWDQISANPDEVPVPESHLQLAQQRLRRYRENPEAAKPAFEVIDRLTRKSK